MKKVVFNLPVVMSHAGIRTQKELAERITEYNPNIKVRPLTISQLTRNQLKHLPVELIHGICAVTNSKPGDWIDFIDVDTKPEDNQPNN